jgi:phosphoglycerol transferase MdoB-like AlkP superfamily enzyme
MNSALFSPFTLFDFLHGLRFDLVAVSWLLIPYFLFELLPLANRRLKNYRILLRFLFLIPMVISLILNVIDFEFYSFTLRRMTADMIAIVSTGEDTLALLPQFFLDYWSTVLLFIGLCVLADFLFRKTEPKKFPEQHHYLLQFAIFIIGASVVVVGSRGGFQLRPIGIISASTWSTPQNVAVVLNTPFTFLKSLGKDHLELKHYFEEPELSHIFNPRQTLKSAKAFEKRNVVLVILESFSKEYIGGYGNSPSYTPFLDSLMKKSLVFTNFYANGKRSIEALPAIFSALPALMNTPYISSPYAGNKITSLAKKLKEKGYHTSFFHGGTNGTMGFDAFASMVEIEHYYGRTEYANENDFDGNWGIYDEPFVNYFARTIDTIEQPFFTTFFSLSSHHPYSIPKQYTDLFPKGNLEIHETIGYTDMALKGFFEKSKDKAWFNNSVFLITADHTAQATSPYYQSNVGMYAIPLIVYDPTAPSFRENINVSQQADIPAIVLNTLHYTGHLLSFGKNPMEKGDRSFCINFNNGIYQFISNGYCLRFDGTETIGMYNLKKDSLLTNNLVNDELDRKRSMERTVMAIVQSYSDRLITNSWQDGKD